MSETKQLDELHADPKNPRTMRRHEGAALAKAMKEYGDLSPIVFNVRTQNLVGGHQRIEALNKVLSGAKQVTISQRFEQPDSVGTVGLGYVEYDGRQFAYREVDWDMGKQRSANIAANRIQGEFNLDMLAEVTHEIAALENSAELLDLTGQSDDEIENLLKATGAVENEDHGERPNNKLTIEVDEGQRETIDEAIGNIKARQTLHPGPDSSFNGSALYYICKDYLERLHQEQDTRTITEPVVEQQPPAEAPDSQIVNPVGQSDEQES